jgi:hypothetical protein
VFSPTEIGTVCNLFEDSLPVVMFKRMPVAISAPTTSTERKIIAVFLFTIFSSNLDSVFGWSFFIVVIAIIQVSLLCEDSIPFERKRVCWGSYTGKTEGRKNEKTMLLSLLVIFIPR